MSTKAIRCIEDCVRHGGYMEVVCRCGHSAQINAREALRRFQAKKWHTGFQGAVWLVSAHARFRCSKCGEAPVRIGPSYR